MMSSDNRIGFREVLQVAAPLIISMGSLTLMQFCDRIFLAWHSPTSIEAALPGGILAFTLMCVFVELAGFANSFVSQYHGAGDKKGCSRATAQAVFMAILAWPLILALIPVGRWIIRISGHPTDVTEAEIQYLTILMLGGVGPALNAAAASFFTGRGQTRVPMAAGISANIVNIFLAYGLIFGRFGLPALGMKGAAIATVIASFVSPVILLGLFFSRRIDREYESRRCFRLDLRLFRRMARFGILSAGSVLLDVSAFALFVMITGRLEGVALASSNIALSINNLAFMPLLGLHIAAATLVGKYQGAKRPDLAATAGWTVLKAGLVYMTAIAVTFLLFPGQYYGLFMRHGGASFPVDQMLETGRWLLLMMATWGLFDTVSLVLAGGLKGAGDTRFVMVWSSMMAWFVWVPGQFIVLVIFKGGILMLWVWMATYIILLASGFLLRFMGGGWKKIELIERHAPVEPTQPGAEALISAP